MPLPAELEQLGVRVGAIQVVRNNVFDTSQPGENKSVFRFANKLHMTTRESHIRQHLLIRSGDLFDHRKILESQRLLRKNPYIYEANIQAINYRQGVVDLVVSTQDVWTLDFKLSAGRSGGKNRSGIGIKEQNLFGTGTLVNIKYKNDIDRNSTSFEFARDLIGEGRYRGRFKFANNSDGQAYQTFLGRPFYSLDDRRAFGMNLDFEERDDQVYLLGNVVDEYQRQSQDHEVFYAWSNGMHNGWVNRYRVGIADVKRNFNTADETTAVSSIPDDYHFTYPFIGFEIIEDKFATTENFNEIDRTEDIQLGTVLRGNLGYASDAFGNSDSSILGDVNLSHSIGDIQNKIVIFSGGVQGRWDNGTSQDLIASLSADFYWRQTESLVFYSGFNADFGNNLDLDNVLYLGGDTGLRGYPLRYQRGENRWNVTLEQRFFTSWKPFKLFQVGAAIFFDAGRASENPIDETTNAGLLSNIGVGLRLGNRRSAGGRMIHIDLAFPIDAPNDVDNMQFQIGAKKKF